MRSWMLGVGYIFSAVVSCFVNKVSTFTLHYHFHAVMLMATCYV